MNRLRLGIALALTLSMPLGAIAQQHPRNSGTANRAPARSAPARPAPSRPAPSRPATQSHPGFNLNRDYTPPANSQRNTGNREPAPNRGATAPNHGGTGHPAYNQGGNGPYGGRFHGSRISNPRYNGQAWGWNRGTVWNASPAYWGGGFWGAFAIASLAGALIYGSIDYDQEVYPSYEVAPDSPGAEVLQSYGLGQTQCGPPNLVVIWGPDNSVICAYPNNLVAPGNYELDPSTLTLVAQQ